MDQVVKCTNCNAEIPEEERGRFCPYCGSLLRGWSKTNVQQGFQYYKKKLSTSETLSKGYSILMDNIKPILVYWTLPVMLIIILSFMQQYTLSNITTAFEGVADFSVLMDLALQAIFITIPLSLITTILELIFIGGIVGMAQEAYYTGTTSYETGFKSIKKHPLGIIGASILITLAVNFGLVLCIIPGLFLCYWWLFAIPMIVIEGKNIFDSLSDSKKFAKDNKTLKFTIALIGVLIVMNIVGIILSSVISFFFRGEIFSISSEVIVTPIITGLVTLLGMSFVGICITVHFLKGRPPTAEKPGFDKPTPPPPDLLND